MTQTPTNDKDDDEKDGAVSEAIAYKRCWKHRLGKYESAHKACDTCQKAEYDAWRAYQKRQAKKEGK